MLYSMQKYHDYLLGSHFKFYINHFALKCIVNIPVLGGRIFRWIFLFKAYDFDIIVKLGKTNVGPNHLSHIMSREEGTSVDDSLSNSHLFWVIMVY